MDGVRDTVTRDIKVLSAHVREGGEEDRWLMFRYRGMEGER